MWVYAQQLKSQDNNFKTVQDTMIWEKKILQDGQIVEKNKCLQINKVTANLYITRLSYPIATSLHNIFYVPC